MDVSNRHDADQRPVWVPENTASIPMNVYREHINSKFRQNLRTTQQLHRWTVTNPHQFWIDLYNYVALVPPLPSGTTKAYDGSLPMSSIPKFFEAARINYAENVLSNRAPNAIALIGLREGQGLDGEQWTWKDLIENVRVANSALKRSGVKEGDRIGALMSNSVWTIALFLAAASMGAVFTSINPDLGDEVWVLFPVLTLLLTCSRDASLVFNKSRPRYFSPIVMLHTKVAKPLLSQRSQILYLTLGRNPKFSSSHSRAPSPPFQLLINFSLDLPQPKNLNLRDFPSHTLFTSSTQVVPLAFPNVWSTSME
jgi:hypothetical protein